MRHPRVIHNRESIQRCSVESGSDREAHLLQERDVARIAFETLEEKVAFDLGESGVALRVARSNHSKAMSIVPTLDSSRTVARSGACVRKLRRVGIEQDRRAILPDRSR